MKKKIIALCLVVCLLAIAIVGGTLAYFTDTDVQTNVFTAGKVGINLNEAVVELDTVTGNLVATDERTEDAQSYHLYPAQVVEKDPTITVDGDSEDCYVAAKITITSGAAGDIEELIYSTGHYNHMIDISKIISGGFAEPGADMKYNHPLYNLNGNGMPVYGDATYSAYQEVLTDDNGDYTGEYIIYIFVEDVKAAYESVTLFNKMTIPTDWDNAEMAIMNGTTIKVEAFATQTNGFADCFTAITTAFGANENDPFYFAELHYEEN